MAGTTFQGVGGSVRIRLLGGFEVTVGGRPVPAGAWRLRKAKTLVKLLALAEGHRMHRDALMSLLWPDHDSQTPHLASAGSSTNSSAPTNPAPTNPASTNSSASNNLHQVLYVARRALAGSDLSFPLREDVVLLGVGRPPWLDVEEFELACRRARTSRDPADYRAAAALYRGDLLPEDRFEPWAEGPRDQAAERRLALLAEYAEVLTLRGEYAEVVEVAGTVTAVDPFHERAHRLLMTALAAGGRRYEALAAFDRLRDGLAEQFAADPEPQTRRLYRQLLTGDPFPATEDDHAPGIEISLAPLPLPGGLNLEQTSFIGRTRELAEIAEALTRTRLLTLTGPGGAGKTRLACAVVASLHPAQAASHPDGVHLVELASLARPDLVPHAVAAVLGLRLTGPDAPEIALARHLTDRRLLLLLDNCEHLLAACARLVAALLRRCAGVRVLATSREPLRVGGEVTWRTPSLTLPDLRALPPVGQLAAYESVRLFVTRARDVTPTFSLDDGTAAAVAEICVRLDGMPLALELAAARTSALSPAQIALRLGDALHVLDRGSRSALTRQQTLSATLTWSHDLLTDDERVLFRRLAVFRGSLSLEAVENVCAGVGLDIVELLTGLVDKSLVQVEHAGPVVRYRLLETIRQFAGLRLIEAGEQDAIARAHREFFGALARANDPELVVGIVNHTPASLEAERDNLRAALSTGLLDDPPSALRLALSLWRFWLARGDFSEAGRWLAATVSAAPEPTRARAAALLAASAIEVRRGDPDRRQLDLGSAAVTIMRGVGDDRALARTLHQTGLLSWVSNDSWQRAVDLVEEAAGLAAAAGDAGTVASATHTLGVIAASRGDAAQAVSLLGRLPELLAAVPADQPPFFLAITPGHFWERGPGGFPRLPFTQTVLLFRRAAAGQASAYALVNLAYAVSLTGDPGRSPALLTEALRAFDGLGDRYGVALTLCRLATMHRLKGEFARAATLLERSLTIRRELGDRRAVGMTLLNQGLLAAGEGDLGRADHLMRAALKRFDEMADGPGRSGTLLNLGLVLSDAGEHGRARRELRRWHALPPISWTFRPRAWALLTLAALERVGGDDASAVRYVREARLGFEALADEAGLAYLAEHAEPTLSGR